MGDFKEVAVQEVDLNPFKAIGDDWMLVTAGTLDDYNTMTASWGGMGILWDKKICIIFIRRSRHTYKFTEKNEYFTLSFFNTSQKSALQYCGSHSGRDVDKAEEAGITPIFSDDAGNVYFKEACKVFICRKIYYQDIEQGNFLDTLVRGHYPTGDYHRMYVGEVVQVLSRD